MKGLNKITLIAAIAAASSAQAEMVSMDEAAMSEATGQAGITIDINAADIKIGAIDYKDQGFLSIKGVHLTGSQNAFGVAGGDGILNDIQIHIDVAGANLDLGRTKFGGTLLSQTAAISTGQANGNYVAPVINDGDLVISALTGDLSNLLRSVDFGLSIDSVGLGKSTDAPGAVVDGTVLVQNLSLAGYLGPTEIIIDGQNGGVNISTYFNAEGSLEMPFMNVKTDFAIHDSRGNTTTWLATQDKANSTAHAQINIKQGVNSSGNTALALDLQNFEADIDLENFTLGNTPAIGDIYITDLRIVAQTVIYGH